MNSDDHAAWNETMARRHNPDTFITQSGAPIRWIEKQRMQRIVEALGEIEHGSVLDVGCGAGNLMEKIRAQRLVGVDLSDFLLSLARQRLLSRSTVEVLKADAEKLPFPNRSFDAVSCSEVIEHVLHPEAVLQEIIRVVKPGGRVVISFPNESLINLTKRAIGVLGLKKWVAGDYAIADNMLDEWHVNEISMDWVLQTCAGSLRRLKTFAVPLPILAYHYVLAFDVVRS